MEPRKRQALFNFFQHIRIVASLQRNKLQKIKDIRTERILKLLKQPPLHHNNDQYVSHPVLVRAVRRTIIKNCTIDFTGACDMYCHFMLTNNIWIFIQSSSACQIIRAISAGCGKRLQDCQRKLEKLVIHINLCLLIKIYESIKSIDLSGTIKY